MRIYIQSYKPVHQGAGVKIELALENEETGERASASVTVSFDDYSDMTSFIKAGEISEEVLSVLEEKARIYQAYSYGTYLLGFGECSRKKMVYKLERKGHDRESAERAADMLVQAGYINEFELIHEAMLHACRDKCYGRKRIISELYAKGFEREDIREAFRLYEGELDYDEAKRQLICRKYGTDKPEFSDIKEKQKMLAMLYRYGHDAGF